MPSTRTLALLLVLLPPFAVAQDPATITRVGGSEQGFIIFQERCMTCHGRPEVEHAPPPELLRAMPAERIYEALTKGSMQVHARDLEESDIRAVAEAVSGQLLGASQAGDAAHMPNRCRADSAFDPSGRAWNGWSPDVGNSRHQNAANAGISAADIPKLKLLWAFGFPGGSSAYGQPSIVGGQVFVGSDNGYVYSLDAATGCVHWSFRGDAGVRTSVSVGPVKGHAGVEYAAFFGDVKANLYAVDARSGRLLWRQRVDEHLAARMTASPVLHDGVLYVPMSAWEEGAARAESYPCCTFRGSVSAYEVSSGRLLWKTYTIAQTPQPTRKNSAGVQLYAPAGAAVWNTPAIDPAAGALYFGTGNAYTEPAAETSDSVIALDLSTGAVRWTHQVYANDAFLVGCGAVNSENCPKKLGPDRDIPASPILVTHADGTRSLIVAARPNEVLAFDPDNGGKLRWRVQVPRNGNGRGLIWGGTTDGENAYFGLSSGGMVAVSLRDGTERWYSPIAPGSHGAVASSIEGAVLIGGLDGVIRALSTKDGSVIWQYATDREFETVNGVKARGGSITAAGAVITDGKVFATSGYSVIFGKPGNVLLAFGLDG